MILFGNPDKFKISRGDYKTLKDIDFEFTIDNQGKVFGHSYYQDDTLYIHDFNAEPMRSGYGSRVFNFLVDLMKTKNIKIIIVDKEDDALPFWEKMGY